MYALVFAAHGIVGEDDSYVRLFDDHDDAHAAMYWSMENYIIENHADDKGFDDYGISEDHAWCESDGNGPEWHIYEVLPEDEGD